MKRRRAYPDEETEIDRPDVKALRLSGQVARALSLALSSFDDDVLLSLSVTAVEPHPGASRLLVTVTSESGDPAHILQRLNTVRGLLRAEVASCINRKRAPELEFRVEL